MMHKQALLSLALLVPFFCNADNKAEARTTRKADHTVDNIFVERWSPRAMTGESISDDDVLEAKLLGSRIIDHLKGMEDLSFAPGPARVLS